MTRYLLDTNIVSDLVRRPQGPAAQRIFQVGEAAICTSVIVTAELRYGAAKLGSPRLSAQLETVLGPFEVIPFEPPADTVYGKIRAQLERMGRVIGNNDMLIAAHAIALDCTLVTANQREFSRVEGLRLENWLK